MDTSKSYLQRALICRLLRRRQRGWKMSPNNNSSNIQLRQLQLLLLPLLHPLLLSHIHWVGQAAEASQLLLLQTKLAVLQVPLQLAAPAEQLQHPHKCHPHLLRFLRHAPQQGHPIRLHQAKHKHKQYRRSFKNSTPS